jgi:hypothetical protein
MTKEKQKIVIVIGAGASWFINNAVKEIFHIPHDGFIVINPSQRKGVYDALMHDFKLGF